MRKRIFSLMIIPCLMLSGCAGGGNVADRVRDSYGAADKMKLQAALKVDYGDLIMDFKLSLGYDRNGESSVTVMEPEELAGMKTVYAADGTRIEYDGMTLESAPVSDGLSPMNFLYELVSCWGGGLAAEQGTEKRDGVNCVVISSEPSTGIRYRTWFRDGDLSPLYAEASVDGLTAIYCTFESYEPE